MSAATALAYSYHASRRAGPHPTSLACAALGNMLALGRPTPDRPKHRGVELYAGVAAITRHCILNNVWVVPIDKSYGADNDVNKEEGVHYALTSVLRIRPSPRAFLWAAVDCRTYAWIGRSTTGRRAHCPSGDVTQQRIVEANIMLGVTTLLLLIGWLKGVPWGLENPKSSIVALVEPLATFVKWLFGGVKPRMIGYLAHSAATV